MFAQLRTKEPRRGEQCDPLGLRHSQTIRVEESLTVPLSPFAGSGTSFHVRRLLGDCKLRPGREMLRWTQVLKHHDVLPSILSDTFFA